jgi:hypothetical protein
MKELQDCQRAVELAQKRDMTKEFAAASAQLRAVHLSTLHHLSTCQTASPRCAFLDPFVYLHFLGRCNLRSCRLRVYPARMLPCCELLQYRHIMQCSMLPITYTRCSLYAWLSSYANTEICCVCL